MKKVVVSLLAIVSFHSHANLTWTGHVEIVQLYPNPNGLQFFISKPTGFSTCEANRLRLDRSHDEYNTYVSVLIAAYMAGRKIDVAIESNVTPTCSAPVYKFKVY